MRRSASLECDELWKMCFEDCSGERGCFEDCGGGRFELGAPSLPSCDVQLVWSLGLSGKHLDCDPSEDKHDCPEGPELGTLYAGKKVIGAGTFGKAIDAVFKPSNTRVVLKTVRKRADSIGKEYLENFVTRDNVFTLLLEISTPERAHANVVRYVDVLLCSSHVCVIMEPLLGPELFEWLEEAWQQMSEDKLRDVMKQMLAAIRFTHESGLIHRDVKITAFRFRTAHAAAPLVLFDYGLCCVSASAPRARAIVGTPEYIAPEMGLGVYDDKVDVWSVAVCFYAMLATSFLVEFDLGSQQTSALIRIVTRDELERALKNQALDYAISPSAVSFTKRLLIFEPASRPSAAEAHDLICDDDAWRAIAAPTLQRSESSPAMLAKGAHAQLLRQSRMSTAHADHAHPERHASDEDAVLEQIAVPKPCLPGFKYRSCMR